MYSAKRFAGKSDGADLKYYTERNCLHEVESVNFMKCTFSKF